MPSTARRSLLAHVVKVVVQFSFALIPNGLQSFCCMSSSLCIAHQEFYGFRQLIKIATQKGDGHLGVSREGRKV